MKVKDLKEIAYNILEEGRAETDYIEYKTSAKQKDKILKTICALSNNYMNREYGFIFIGIEEVDDEENGIKAIPVRPIKGIEEGEIEIIENNIRAMFKYIQPTPICHFIPDMIDDKWYLAIAVEPSMKLTEVTQKGANAVGLPKGGRYIRESRSSILPNTRQEYELLRKFARYSFCDDYHPTATLDDLNYEYMKEYLVRSQAAYDLRKLPKEDMARMLKLVGEDGLNENRVKNFALLMFADRPEDYIPGAHVEIVVESKDGTSRMSVEKFEGPIWIQAQQVRNYFKERVERSYTLRESGSIYHRIVKNWSDVAWNEISTNMILHKNYDNPNYAGIYIYHDHISFINHNRPMPPVSIKDLQNKITFDNRQYLNPQLKEMFYALNLIESYGSGIRRAKNALKDNGNPELVFYPSNEQDDYTQVIMPINNEYKEYEENDIKKVNTNNDIKLPKNQKIVYDTILNNPGLRIPAISEICGLKETTVYNAITKLRNKGFVEYIGNSKTGGYIIKSND